MNERERIVARYLEAGFITGLEAEQAPRAPSPWWKRLWRATEHKAQLDALRAKETPEETAKLDDLADRAW